MIKLKSTNPKFSWILRKNPETQTSKNEPFSKALRKGKVYGWFNGEQEFRMWFKDSPTESSFNTISDFEYLDRTRYSSPYLPIAMIGTLLASAQKDQVEEDSVGFDHSFEAIVEFSELNLARRLTRILPEELKIEFDHLGKTLCKVKFSTNVGIRYLLNWVISYLIVQAVQDENLYIPMDEDSVKKYVNALVNIDAPYYMRYITAMKCIRSPSTFSSIKELFEDGKFDLNFGNTQNHRWVAIEKQLGGGDRLMDIGCGELFYTKKLRSRYEFVDTWDADEEIQSKNVHLAEIRGWNNVEFLGKYDQFSTVPTSKFTDVLLTEVLEHIEFEESDKLLNHVLSGNFQKVLVTVPNKDFNRFYGLSDTDFRHDDHKFEPTEGEFKEWMWKISKTKGVSVEFFDVGDGVLENGKFIRSSLGCIFTNPFN